MARRRFLGVWYCSQSLSFAKSSIFFLRRSRLTLSSLAPITTSPTFCSNLRKIRERKLRINYISALKSSYSNFLYMLSPSSFSFSSDPLNSDWCTVNPPLVWRSDPIVARVGDAVVVTGGACYFEDDPLVVEMYDLQTRSWCTCESMPESLKDSVALLWFSVATTKEKLIVTDKKSDLTHWFDTVTKSWSDSIYLNPSQPVCGYHIGCSKYGLILVSVSRTDDSRRVRIWQVSEEDFSCEEIEEGCSVPFLHVGECVAKELKEAKFRPFEAGSPLRIGVLSTNQTLVPRFYQEKLENEGFEVILPDKATMEHAVIPAVEALNREDFEGAQNLFRIALQVLLVRAVNRVILASDELKQLLPKDDPLWSKCIDPMDSLARSSIKIARFAETGN